ncbi:hypothetical protein N431DRAFT_435935 [Stipitochalara longipes BDJ]|nr:hypothetical protein N431DRAFT_435935 [Stipitochalara longipes BDJ]
MPFHRRNPSIIIPDPPGTITINEALEYAQANVQEGWVHLVVVRDSGSCRMFHVLRDIGLRPSLNGNVNIPLSLTLRNQLTFFTQYELSHDFASNNMASNDDVRACMGQIEKIGNHLGIKENEVKFAMNILKTTADIIKAKDKQEGNVEGPSKSSPLTPDIYEAYCKHITSGGKPLKQVAVKKSTKGSTKTDLGDNWGKWQRMGGDPRMHKAFNLSSAPYTPTEGMKWVGAEDPDYPDDGKDDAGAKADISIKMVPALTPEEILATVMLMEIEKMDNNKKAKVSTIVADAAKGFDEEDDDTFIPNLVRPPSERVELKGLQGTVPKHKNVETLRKLLSPVARPSSLSNSPYLNALGNSGVAPPPGLYNNFSGMASSPESGFQSHNGSGMASNLGMTSSSGMANTPSSGLLTQNPYRATMSHQPVSSSPLSHWSQMKTTPTLGFYETMTPGPDSGNMGMHVGGRRSSLGHIARSVSRSGMHSNVGSGTPLRADSPAFHSTLGSTATRPIFPSPEFGIQAMQEGGVQGQHASASVSGRTGSRAAGIYVQPVGGGMGSSADSCANDDGLDSAARNLNKWLS